MSNASWQTGLQQALTRSTPPDRSPRVAVVGIGHELRGDDAVGLAVARRLLPRRPAWLVLAGGSAPENCAGTVRRFGPDLVVLVDAANLEAPPGAIQWLECDQIGGLSASTHTLPLSLLATYLAVDLGCTVGILAIQPACDDIGARLSPPVRHAAQRVAQVLSAIGT